MMSGCLRLLAGGFCGVLELLGGPEPTARQLPADEPCDWQRDFSVVSTKDHRGYYEATPTCGTEAETGMAGFYHACYREPGHDGDHGCLCGHVWSTAALAVSR